MRFKTDWHFLIASASSKKNADKGKIKASLLQVAGIYSKATTFASYEKRIGAEAEIAQLLKSITKGEYSKCSAEERTAFGALATKISGSQFKSDVPSWVPKSLVTIAGSLKGRSGKRV